MVIVYQNKTKEEWREVFIREFQRIQPSGYTDYNHRRNRDIPHSVTISKLFGIYRWSEWLAFCGLRTYKPQIERERERKSYNVTIHSRLLERLKDLDAVMERLLAGFDDKAV